MSSRPQAALAYGLYLADDAPAARALAEAEGVYAFAERAGLHVVHVGAWGEWDEADTGVVLAARVTRLGMCEDDRQIVPLDAMQLVVSPDEARAIDRAAVDLGLGHAVGRWYVVLHYG